MSSAFRVEPHPYDRACAGLNSAEGCIYCCDRCNYDRHVCPGCGDSLRHDEGVCRGCRVP